MEAILLYYALTRQPVWIRDNPSTRWFARILLVLPGAVVIQHQDGPHDTAIAVIPTSRIISVQERCASDRDVLEDIFNRPDEPGATAPVA